MPRDKGKGKVARSKKVVDTDSDDDYNSSEGENNKFPIGTTKYDEPEQDIEDDDILVDGDMEDEEEWDEDDVDDVDNNDGDEDDDDCVYETSRRRTKINGEIERDDEDDDDNNDDDLNIDDNDLNPDNYVLPEDRISPPNLTKYEKVRLLGDRTAQLLRGAKSMIKGTDGLDARVVAQLELESKMIPIKIKRILPNGKKEEWKLSELYIRREFIKYGFYGGTLDRKEIDKRTEEFQKGGNIDGFSRLFPSMIDTVAPVKAVKKTKSKSKSRTKTKSKEKVKRGNKSRSSKLNR